MPVKVGAGGAEQIIELSLSKEELSELKKSAEAVEELVGVMANSE